FQPNHRPAAIGRDGTRNYARHTLPHFRRADGLSNPSGDRATLRIDRSSQGQGRHYCLYFAPFGGSVPARGPRHDPSRWPAGFDPARRRNQRAGAHHRHDRPLDRTNPLQGDNPFRHRDSSYGKTHWKGQPVDIRREKDAISRGIALVPESRRDQGLCLNLGVGLNINLPIYKRLTKGFVIDNRAERTAADRQIRDVQIKTASRDAPASSLSGGNQQKIVVGKWLNHGAQLFIFDEPTVGVDVGTKVEIYKLFAKLLKDGAGIILISSYLPEVYDLADTLHVFRRGRLVATHDSSHTSEKALHETILTEALGV